MFFRWFEKSLAEKIAKPYVHILFGARQVGKTTLLSRILPPDSLHLDLSDPVLRNRFLAFPEEFSAQCRALPMSDSPSYVFIDEVQLAPQLFDLIQHLYDNNKQRWRFILCGSSARKLRTSGTNLLPGRSLLHHLYPLIMQEMPTAGEKSKNKNELSILPQHESDSGTVTFPPMNLEDRLSYGNLPGVAIAQPDDRPDILKAYTALYLEEEIRREALVKNLGTFIQFLRFAAISSGLELNYTSISRETGLSVPTIISHYQLLEDMFIGFKITAFSKSPRKNVLKSPKFLFFDIGVRHSAAGLTPSLQTVEANPGPIFEQWVGIELWTRLQYAGEGRLLFLRTRDGMEIDYIVERGDNLIPIEVKWSKHPNVSDCKHLLKFLADHPKATQKGYIICRCDQPMQIHERIIALPWWGF